MNRMFCTRVFRYSGIYGIAILVPLYLLEDEIALQFPPVISHPEQFYGFIGVALAWQFAFLTISRDVVRFRPLMVPAILEKVLSASSTVWLYLDGRVARPLVAPAFADLVIAVLFVASYWRTMPRGYDRGQRPYW